MQIFISNDVYPSTRDWDNLKRWLPKILKFPIDAKNNVDRWRISLIPLIPAGKKFYPNRASYTFFITVHFHHREESRLNKSLIKACLDIEENGDKETDKIINMLCIHIPAYVSLENYANWCRNYLRAIPESQISGMRLIQPVLAVDTSRDKSFLAFSYRDIIKPERLKNWFKANNRRLNGEFVVGVPTTKPIDIIFNPSGYDLARRHYIYQSGNIYYLYDELTDGSMKGNVRFDYGVHTHAVMRLFREDTIWSGKFPPNDELLIL